MFTRLQWALLQPFLKNKEDSSAGKVADVAEDIPGRLGVALAETQLFFHRAQQAGAARMQNPSFDFFALLAIAVQEAVHKLLDAFANHFGDVFVEDELEARVEQLEDHDGEGGGETARFRDQHLWADPPL